VYTHNGALMDRPSRPARALRWIGSSRKDYGDFPSAVQENFGFELFLAQIGQHPPSAKWLRGLGGGTVELVDDFDGDTYRAVYTTSFETAVYVLHSFKKKSKTGIRTAQHDIDLIRRRLKDAEADHYALQLQEKKP
jgi:phage-related protein